MKALVYTAPGRVELRDEPDPAPGPGEVTVQIGAVGICGSDMHAFLGHDPRRVPPLILGHEAAGTIVEGPGAGRRVVVNPLISCGRCDYCVGGRPNLCPHRELIGMNRPGVFAEAVAVPERNLIPVPDGLTDVHAALTEPAATALHAVALAAKALARPVAEARALVIGAGSVGLCAALILKDQGCAAPVVAEANPLRRQTAHAAGVADTVDPAAGALPDNGFDLVVDAVGAVATRTAAVAAVVPGGVIMHIGLQDSEGVMDVRRMTLSEITFIGTYTYTPIELRATIAKLASGALGSLDWVESRALGDGAGAFDDLLHGRAAAPKIVLCP